MVSIPLLRRFGIFEGLKEEELGKIASICREEVYDAGEVIFEEGERADDLYIVVDGEVALEMGLELFPHAPLRETEIEVVRRGEAFGWSALVEPHILTLSAKCNTKTKVIAIEGTALKRLLESDHHLGYKLMARIARIVASRLRDTREKLTDFLRGEELAHGYTPEEAALIQRVHYFIRFRWIAIIGIIVGTLFANKVIGIFFPLLPIFIITAVVAFYNLLFSLFARGLAQKGATSIVPEARKFVLLQSIFDLIALIVLVHFTGGVENPFIFFSVFPIIIVSVLLPYKTAYRIASFTVLLFFGLVGLEYFGLIPHVHLEGLLPPDLYRQERFVLAVLFSLAITLYISTYMASSIAGELRKRQREVASLKDRCITDLKALKEVNKKLMELDRLRTHFLAMASHDLKAPLAAVQSYLQVILGGFVGEVSEKQRQMLERSSLRIEGLLKLINDLLDATRIEEGQIVRDMERVSLKDVVEDSLENVRSIAEEKGLELSTDLPEDLPEIMASRRRLVQVLTNLLNNAVQFTPSGGKVAVRAKEMDDYISVEVMDTGIGIPPEDMPRIFEEFYRGKHVKTKGAGLGLAIAKKIVEAHGGKIWAESPYPESDKGSKFTFTLPKERGGR